MVNCWDFPFFGCHLKRNHQPFEASKNQGIPVTYIASRVGKKTHISKFIDFAHRQNSPKIKLGPLDSRESRGPMDHPKDHFFCLVLELPGKL